MAKPSWISVSPASGTNNGSFDVVAAKNTGAARNGIITVAGGEVSKTVTIDQKIGAFKVKSIRLTGQSARPTNVTIGSKKFYLGGNNPSSVIVPDDATGLNIHTVIDYKTENIGHGGINIIFEFSDKLSDLQIATQNISSYINLRLNGSQFMISCGNGFPTVPISNKIIAMFKNSVGTYIVNFDFYTV
jgi:hypothetical protein